MIDKYIRKNIDPALNGLGKKVAQMGLSANMATSIGLLFGLCAGGALAIGWFQLALGFILVNRIFDGLDGAIARSTEKTDFGGYYDIVADFFFYGLVPMGFVIANPADNGAAGAFLLASFYVNGASFLGYAILAEKHKMETAERGEKTLYYTGGLLEGSETIGFFIFICLWPESFSVAAFVFATLCFFTACSRVLLAFRVFARLNSFSR